VLKSELKRAEISALLRFSNALHIVSGKIVIEVEVDTGQIARRLRSQIFDLYGFEAEFLVMSPSGINRSTRYVVRLVNGGGALARRVGLIDGHGRPVRGLPAQIVSGSKEVLSAAWRGAFLARGSITEPGRSMSLGVTCPGADGALALAGAARRLGITAKAREVRGVDRVVIREGDAIAALLTRMGAHEAVLEWEDRRVRKEVKNNVNRMANFDDANMRRSVRAAVAAGQRAKRALEILGDDVPEHLLQAAELRIANSEASLEELGQMHDPVLTKDAIAGRIRRLLAMADKRARELGIPDTEQALEDLLRD
jgi:DNA-binding protein WhiA